MWSGRRAPPPPLRPLQRRSPSLRRRFLCDAWLKRNAFNVRTGGVPISHSRIDGGWLSGCSSGKFCVPDNRLAEFRQVLASDLATARYYYHEVVSDVFPLFIDLDGVSVGADAAGSVLAPAVSSCFGSGVDASAVITASAETATRPGGMHVHFPGVLVDKVTAHRVRLAALQHLADVTQGPQGELEHGAARAAWQAAWDVPILGDLTNERSLYVNGLRITGCRKSELCKDCRGVGACQSCGGLGRVDLGRVYTLQGCYNPDGSRDREAVQRLSADIEALLNATAVRIGRSDAAPCEPLPHVVATFEPSLPKSKRKEAGGPTYPLHDPKPEAIAIGTVVARMNARASTVHRRGYDGAVYTRQEWMCFYADRPQVGEWTWVRAARQRTLSPASRMGTVTAVADDGTVTVQWEDGEEEPHGWGRRACDAAGRGTLALLDEAHVSEDSHTC
eukprot:TRINITY_DN5725_c0_g1_i2.p2 TRINITY_DN5725_c0_g1~~TRINITY_DN5725_c0_g1_i2.p2  ORF type:complete len:447 (+),score=99.76 TRINITY_DN5725_c0_g1_i2:259-1599(+)